jgi:hypothetical protein
MGRPDYRDVLDRLALVERLAEFDPHIAGTPPLGLDMPTSDIDVLCHAPDGVRFTEAIRTLLGGAEALRIEQWIADARPVIASFRAHGWTIEIFAHPSPVLEQAGWRHFLVEQRLLEIGGNALRSAVMAERERGLKTEPAFAAALALSGDPYDTLLALERLPQTALRDLLGRVEFVSPD